MGLSKQISLYNVDTNAFLTDKEKQLKNKCNELLYDRLQLDYEQKKNKSLLNKLNSMLNKLDNSDFDIDYRNSIYNKIYELTNNISLCMVVIEAIDDELKWRKKIQKEDLLLEFLRHVTINKMRRLNNKDIRELDSRYIDVKNIVSMFSSSLSRCSDIEIGSLTEDIFIIDVFYFDIAQDIILNGFYYKGNKYIYYSSSAGQIRTKKVVFIKESLFKEHEKQLMCGLSLDIINSKGGMNINKYLAYLSLNNSATDTWEEIFDKQFDIDRCIVVDDFETLVNCKVDSINYETYEITQNVQMDIPIPHTDGCGMILPSYSNKNFMVRLPWIKGLLGSFDFKGLCQENKWNTKIKDIWGKEYDIIDDDIQIIFTKSQLKMYKYYESWNQYKTYFKQYKCEACVCNMEEDNITNSKINYQMLQSLYNMTDKEIVELCKLSNDKIDHLSDSLENMLKVFGVNENRDFDDLSYLQQALTLYPELVKDISTKDTLRDLKNSMVKQYKSGKLDVIGKYTFVLPDLYAFCEWLFCGFDVPNGVFDDGEVYCNLFKKQKELDCLRAPHLYIEHAVRKNMACIDNQSKKEENTIKKYKWFQTNAIYTSTRDLISRILQFDVDGDHLLVIAQQKFINIAKRHMKGINPLYYEMKKAKAEPLDYQVMYKGLTLAFTGGNIGMISNDITKIWNGSDGITQDELNAIKWLCMETNFTIDYAKTLFKPTRTKEANSIISKYHKKKVPYFFQYAKDKISYEDINNSTMNRIVNEIHDTRLSFMKINRLSKLDYKILMNNKNVCEDERVFELYNDFNDTYGNKLNIKNGRCINEKDIVCEFKLLLHNFGYNNTQLSDMLSRYLYSKPTRIRKNLYWATFGDIIIENIKNNIDSTTKVCKQCGKRMDEKYFKLGLCPKCMEHKKIIKCVDCGKDLIVDILNTKSCRCELCQKTESKKINTEFQRIKRLNNLSIQP